MPEDKRGKEKEMMRKENPRAMMEEARARGKLDRREDATTVEATTSQVRAPKVVAKVETLRC